VPDPPATRSGLRIAQVLADLKHREGSYLKLQKAIERANAGEAAAPLKGGKKAPRTIDRRKLKSIVDNDPGLVLSLGELRALDRYLEPFGHGLAYNPLFEKPQVLGRIAQTRRAAFLLGSKTDKNDPFRINISHWDFLGLSHIQAGLLGFPQNVYIDIREVRMHDQIEDARAALRDPELKQLFGDGGPSLICLGSSRGNQVANWMLCRMVGREPFDSSDSRDHPELPIHFVWPLPQDYLFPSPFHLTAEQASREDPAVGEAVKRRAACFRYRGRYVVDELTDPRKREGSTYALCAAQRRPGGAIWLLAAGVTGPATYAAARWASKMATRFDENETDRPSSVSWNLLEARATKVQQGAQVTYRVEDASVVDWG
jgi:hypothetical protein